MNAVAAKLRAACDGHPHATIAWPHRILHEGADEIERLENVLRLKESQFANCHQEIFNLRAQILSYAPASTNS